MAYAVWRLKPGSQSAALFAGACIHSKHIFAIPTNTMQLLHACACSCRMQTDASGILPVLHCTVHTVVVIANKLHLIVTPTGIC